MQRLVHLPDTRDFGLNRMVGDGRALPGLRLTLSPESSCEPVVDQGNCCSLRSDGIDLGASADQHIGLDSAKGEKV